MIYPKIKGFYRQDKQNGASEAYGGVGRLWLSVSTTARLRAAKLMDGPNGKQRAQTSTRRKILPRPNIGRTGANRKRTKERFGTCPNVIQLSLRHSQVSKETAGTGRRPNPNECHEEELIPPSHWQGQNAGRDVQTGQAEDGENCQQMRPGSCCRTPSINNSSPQRHCPSRHICALCRERRSTPLLAFPRESATGSEAWLVPPPRHMGRHVHTSWTWACKTGSICVSVMCAKGRHAALASRVLNGSSGGPAEPGPLIACTFSSHIHTPLVGSPLCPGQKQPPALTRMLPSHRYLLL